MNRLFNLKRGALAGQEASFDTAVPDFLDPEIKKAQAFKKPALPRRSPLASTSSSTLTKSAGIVKQKSPSRKTPLQKKLTVKVQKRFEDELAVLTESLAMFGTQAGLDERMEGLQLQEVKKDETCKVQ